MKGFRTIAFNVIMAIVGIVGASISPEMVDQFLEAFIVFYAAGNALLRKLTDTPIFSKLRRKT